MCKSDYAEFFKGKVMANTNGKKESLRRKSLGELGELIAIKALVDRSFTKVMNLNDSRVNYPFADLYAEEGKAKYVISIKARNKYQQDGTLNAFYKLGSNAHAKAESAENEYGAVAYWMAIQFDARTYSVYFGSLNELSGKKAIPIRKCEEGVIGECLVKDKRHYFDFGYFGNVGESTTYRDRAPPRGGSPPTPPDMRVRIRRFG